MGKTECSWRSNGLKVLLLDYDDTLVRTREVRYKTLIRLAEKRYGFQLSAAEIDAAWGTPGEEFMRMLYGRYTSDFEELWDLYNVFCGEDPNEPYQGALEFLTEFSRLVPMGVVTSSSGKRVFTELEQVGFPKSLFFRVQTAEDTPVHKPNPEVFQPVLRILADQSVAPADVVYVGDSPHDKTAASGAGLHFIGMGHTEHAREHFRLEGVPAASEFQELGRMLRGLISASGSEKR